jgi:L-seryl-tRNA(Ser) seleniumtransferase
LRCDKLVLAALQETVDLHLSGSMDIPIIQMTRVSMNELTARAQRLAEQLKGAPVQASIASSKAPIGGGSSPRSAIPSVCLDLAPPHMKIDELARRLRFASPPVIGSIHSNKLRLDLRTVFPHQDEKLLAAIRAAISPGSA